MTTITTTTRTETTGQATAPSAAPVSIVLRQRGNFDFRVHVEDEPGLWGCGRNPDEAVGSLVRAHPRRFGITVTVLAESAPFGARGEGQGAR